MKSGLAIVLALGIALGGTCQSAAAGDLQSQGTVGGEAARAYDVPASSPATLPVAVAGDAHVSAGLAEGADQEATAEGDEQGGWEVSVMPYLWMAGMKGTVGIPRTSGEIDVDQSFADTVSNLNFAFMSTLEARHDRLVLLGDVLYLSVGSEISGSRDPQLVTGEVDAGTLVASAAAGYRVLDHGPMFVDLFAGARLISLDVETELTGPLATRSASADATTVAPMVGARMHAPLAPRLTLGLYGDVGGIVDGADVKWQLMADLQYSLGDSWTLFGGYRYMAINHNTPRFDYDIDMSGPMLGASRKF